MRACSARKCCLGRRHWGRCRWDGRRRAFRCRLGPWPPGCAPCQRGRRRHGRGTCLEAPILGATWASASALPAPAPPRAAAAPGQRARSRSLGHRSLKRQEARGAVEEVGRVELRHRGDERQHTRKAWTDAGTRGEGCIVPSRGELTRLPVVYRLVSRSQKAWRGQRSGVAEASRSRKGAYYCGHQRRRSMVYPTGAIIVRQVKRTIMEHAHLLPARDPARTAADNARTSAPDNAAKSAPSRAHA